MAAQQAEAVETGTLAASALHLKFIDGLRGLAALYVVLHHSYNLAFTNANEPESLFFLGWGHEAVAIFIVISGYCLALPVARSGVTLRGGALRFYRKRARRILPPYYAALALGVLVLVFVYTPPGHRIDVLSMPLIDKGLLTHLFLIHNWSSSLAYMFNGPLWSVALEVQIYLLFPLMVVIWKKFGMPWMLAGSFVVGHGVYFLTGHGGPANYLFIFALGACAAELSFETSNVRVLKVIFYIAAAAFFAFPRLHVVYSDSLVGLGIAALMVISARTHFWPRSILSFGLFTWLGGFSYSIYLIHDVVQHIFYEDNLLPSGLHQGMPTLLFYLLVVTPIALGVSYLFHVCIERPFMTVHGTSGPPEASSFKEPRPNSQEVREEVSAY